MIKQMYLAVLLIGLTTSLIADDTDSKQRAVLVTGASSGIGLNITNHLVKAGYYVYAGARKEADLKRLDAMPNVSSVKLDVTMQDQIDAAYEFVKSQGRGLYGVINNAGVGTFNRVSTLPVDDIVWMHDINVLGPHRVNLAFLPLLQESKGRTATIGSISGYLVPAVGAAYSMSKMAAEVYIEAYDVDVEEYGMDAALIAPGAYKSKIREKVTMHELTGDYRLAKNSVELTEEQQKRLNERRENNANLKEPDEVSQAVLRFLSAEEPKLRYMVTPNENQAKLTITAAMTRMLEHNEDQVYEFSRDELIKIMDELQK